ncbi:MAG: DUF5989 family protein [Candidatus Nanohaloarchaea archaeon]|nr:DUF5989 family protein [Candidatus Nanohaloarchaea archaeon]
MGVLKKIRETFSSLKERLGIIGEFLGFLWARKLYWMIPIFLMLIVIGALILFAQSSALSPFVYTLV